MPSDAVQYIDISPKQMVGVSAGLIPFLEHDDANRALMGSNMQRQAVPLLVPEPPVVATGLEKDVAQNSGMVVRAEQAGTRDLRGRHAHPRGRARVRAAQVHRAERAHLSEPEADREGRTEGEEGPGARRRGGDASTGELSLGRNVLVAFMSWDGYNFEDAIIISEKLVENDTYTSIHIEEFEIEIRETKLGKEEFTRDIPNVSPKALSNLDEYGIVRIGTFVRPGDILVGKVSPKSKSELTPEEKLLHAIFGRAGEDVKNDILEVPSGVEGIVIDTQRFSRRAQHDRGREEGVRQGGKGDREDRLDKKIAEQFREFIKELDEVLDKKELKDPNTGKPLASDKDDKAVAEQAKTFKLDNLDIRTPESQKKANKIYEPAPGAAPVPHRRAGPQAQLAEARRRAAERRAADGEGLRRHQAGDLGRRQDGRPARQQGRDLARSCPRRTCRSWPTARRWTSC